MNKKDPLAQIKNKKGLFGHYYENFEKHLARKKISKASEFLWGAISSLIYALGITYNEGLNTHRKMALFSKKIAEDEEGENVYRLFKIGEELHANFYHDFLDKEGLILKREEIDNLIKNVGDFLEKRIFLLNQQVRE